MVQKDQIIYSDLVHGMSDKIGEVSSEGFWKDPQSENAVQNAVMWDLIFCVYRPPLITELITGSFGN